MRLKLKQEIMTDLFTRLKKLIDTSIEDYSKHNSTILKKDGSF